MKAVILAGGKGTRLAKYTSDIPKPLLNINGKTVLEYQIDCLKQYNIKDYIFVTGYLGDKIADYFGDGKRLGVNIEYYQEKEPLGTAGALYYIKNLINDDFILMFGDIIFNMDLGRFIDFHKKNNGIATFVVHPNSHPYDSDLVLMDDQNVITGMSYKNTKRYLYNNIVKSGIHLFKKDILDYVEPGKKQDLEQDVVKRVMDEGKYKIYGYKTPEFIKDMGTEGRLESIKDSLQSHIPDIRSLSKKQKCIFIDRDGTLNKYKGLITKEDDIELEDGAAEAVKRINDSGCLCVVITNQPVVARNLCTMDDVSRFHRKLETLLGNSGCYLDDLFFCPHHPDGGYPGENKMYKIKCDCRKPKIGLIQKAAKKYNIDLGKSYFIGDTTVDIQTGKNAGLKTILVKTGLAGSDMKYDTKPDYISDNLLQAVNLINKEGQ